tara:strand:+ start:162 stop:1511 length:1350 start_codon:yes stop_codon:yes gene_type:complete
MKKYLILIFLISFYSFSQDKEELSLEKAIEYGIINSHDIAIVQNDANIIKNSNHLGASGMLPSISISSGYNGSYTNDNIDWIFEGQDVDDANGFSSMFSDVDIGGEKNKSLNISQSISLSYRLFNGFSGIYTLSKFDKQNTIADENIRYQIESKILEIVNQYYDLLNKNNIYTTFKTTHAISLDRYSQALEKYNFGSISKRELLNIEVVLNEDKIKMDEAFINAQSSKLNLALIIGIEASSFSISQDFNFNQNMAIKDLLSQMNNNNSSILMAELNYKVAQDELKISKSSFLPTVNLVSSYAYNYNKTGSGLFSKQEDRGLRGGISVEIPLFSGNMRRKNLQNAKINLDSRFHYLENIKNTIKTALLNAYYSYEDGLNSLELMKKNVATAEKNYAMSKELYEMGQLSNIEYRESQIQLDQIRINYSVKLSATKIQEYVIYQLSGQLKTD